jgi:hypothetical protein
MENKTCSKPPTSIVQLPGQLCLTRERNTSTSTIAITTTNTHHHHHDDHHDHGTPSRTCNKNLFQYAKQNFILLCSADTHKLQHATVLFDVCNLERWYKDQTNK